LHSSKNLLNQTDIHNEVCVNMDRMHVKIIWA
jgi:hypothetical protein